VNVFVAESYGRECAGKSRRRRRLVERSGQVDSWYRHPRIVSSSSGSTRGSADAGIIFELESTGVVARDARVEPRHDAMSEIRVSSFRRLVLFGNRKRLGERRYLVAALIVQLVFKNVFSRRQPFRGHSQIEHELL
jgi:hypothetical protein